MKHYINEYDEYNFDEVKKHIDTLKTNIEKISHLIECKTYYLQNKNPFSCVEWGTTFDKKCQFEIDKINSISSLEAIKTTKEPEPEAIDLSDTTPTEKIIYLQKLGVIDFLRTKQPFNTSINSLATVLSAIAGVNPETKHIQSMLNPIISKEAGQKNNPLNSKNTVSKVEKQLINIGFNLNETI